MMSGAVAWRKASRKPRAAAAIDDAPTASPLSSSAEEHDEHLSFLAFITASQPAINAWYDILHSHYQAKYLADVTLAGRQ